MPDYDDISLDDNNNDLSQPMDGDMANHIAKLITNLTEIKIASLAETALSCLPKAQIDSLLVPFLQPVFCRLTEAFFFGLSDSFTLFGQQLYREVGVPIFTFFLCGFVGMISISCGRNIYQWRSNKQLLSSEVTANSATQERPKPKRSIFLSKYTNNPGQGLKLIGKIYIQEITTDSRQWRSNKQLLSSEVTANSATLERPKPKRSIFLSKYTNNPGQGLKLIGKIYIQEITTDSRQEVEQHHEGTSRAVVPSSISTADDPKSLS